MTASLFLRLWMRYEDETFTSEPSWQLKLNRTRCEICSKLTIETPERSQWRRSGVFIDNFKHVSPLVLVFNQEKYHIFIFLIFLLMFNSTFTPILQFIVLVLSRCYVKSLLKWDSMALVPYHLETMIDTTSNCLSQNFPYQDGHGGWQGYDLSHFHLMLPL